MNKDDQIKALEDLAINLIKYVVDIRAIQYKCFANEYEDVKSVGMSIPTYQTFILQKKMKDISKIDYNEKLCGVAINHILNQRGQG